MTKTLIFQKRIIRSRQPVRTPPAVLEYILNIKKKVGLIVKARWETVEFNSIIKKMTKAIHKEFMRQYREWIKFLENKNAFQELYDYAREEHPDIFEKGKRDDIAMINRYFQGWDENVKPEKMKDVMNFYLPRAGAIGGKRALRELGVRIAFHLKDPKVIAALRKRGEKITGDITKTTLNRFRNIFHEMYMEEGMTPYELKRRIKTLFEETYKNRAMTIARTECGVAQMETQFETYRQNKIKKKRWMAVIDEKTRESHIRVNNEVQLIDEPFSNGLMHPLDNRGPAGEVINCRCDFTTWEVGNIDEIRENPWTGGE